MRGTPTQFLVGTNKDVDGLVFFAVVVIILECNASPHMLCHALSLLIAGSIRH